MSNTFNIKRFGMLFKKHTLEHAKTYALSIGVLTGILFIVLSFYSYINKGHMRAGDQIMVFVFVMAVGGSIFGSMVFADLGDKSKSIPALMLPASHFEKYLVGLLYSYFIFIIVYISAFYLTDSIVVNLGHHELEDEKVIDLFDPEGKSFAAYAMFTMFHAFIFWGAIFFKKLHFIKTAIVFFICVGILALVNVFILNGMLSSYTQFETGMPFTEVTIKKNDNYDWIVPTEQMTRYGKAVFVMFVLMFWTTTYFRLKEKEV